LVAGITRSIALVVVALLSATSAQAATPRPPAVRILVVRTEAEARDAIAAYKSGVPFERLVRDRSIGPERERGGYLGRVDPATLPPEMRAALARTPRGRLAPIVRTPDGFAVIQVLTSREEMEVEARERREPEAQALLERAVALGQAGDLDGAHPLLQRAIELNPDLAEAHIALAAIYRKREQRDAAIAAMRRVVQLRPDDFEAHMALGAWLSEAGLYPDASRAYERAATLQMDSQEAWRKLAESYEAAGKARAALGAYRQLISLQDREDPALFERLLHVAVQTKDGPVAVEAARKLRAFRPGHGGFLALGEALLLNGDAETAIQEFQKAVALAPASAAAHAGLGAAYARVGQAESAREHLRRAVQVEPQNPVHYKTLARFYEELGRLDLAMVALRDGGRAAALSSLQLQVELAEELAALYERAGMTSEAAQERLRAKSLPAP
jgi:Flp pilus assembly protein TadD